MSFLVRPHFRENINMQLIARSSLGVVSPNMNGIHVFPSDPDRADPA